MDPAAAAFAQFIEVGKAQQSERFLFVACLTLVTSDALHCFPKEVRMGSHVPHTSADSDEQQVALIWKSNWNLGKVLFLLSRYLVFVDVGVSIYYNLSPVLTIPQCQKSFAAGSSLTVVGVTIAEAILFLRVYALGGRGRAWGLGLGALYVAIHSAVFGALIKFITSIKYAPSPIPSVIACLPVEAENKMLSVVFILILTSELVILFLTFWLCFTDHKESKSPLILTFTRDGLFYFLLLSAVSTGNIICNLVAPPAYIYLLSM
ncbi:hypothetical protein D9611_004169 [Ephemerocybe angulata]|uniref:DUF6533 domain-containing protein n=1 Tax=Ephemerocybe angulata TaxID=980116 RepID=A0A8H5BK97_9AGAR|nr:hypothetical protein D9611_004169 [Tulosesus angulatus]